MKYLWILLTFGLGLFTLVSVVVVIQDLVGFGGLGSGHKHPVAYGVAFVLVQCLFLALFAFGTRACARQAGRYHQPAPPRSGADRRPWER